MYTTRPINIPVYSIWNAFIYRFQSKENITEELDEDNDQIQEVKVNLDELEKSESAIRAYIILN